MAPITFHPRFEKGYSSDYLNFHLATSSSMSLASAAISALVNFEQPPPFSMKKKVLTSPQELPLCVSSNVSAVECMTAYYRN